MNKSLKVYETFSLILHPQYFRQTHVVKGIKKNIPQAPKTKNLKYVEKLKKMIKVYKSSYEMMKKQLEYH